MSFSFKSLYLFKSFLFLLSFIYFYFFTELIIYLNLFQLTAKAKFHCFSSKNVQLIPA